MVRNIDPKAWSAAVLIALCASLGIFVHAQNTQEANTVATQLTQSRYYTTAISATTAVNNQTTLTIPTPQQGFYNYVCMLHFSASENGSVSANTNQVTTSTNFNSYAIKYSIPGTANTTYDWIENWGQPGAGCTKSAAPTTSTTFVSPAAITNTAFTWTATYYQAP